MTTQATNIRKMGEERCTFVSVWDGDVVLRSRSFYHKDTGSVEVIETHDVEGLEELMDEYIEFADGSIIQICRECHEGILKTSMEPNENDPMDKQLYEVLRCSVCGK